MVVEGLLINAPLLNNNDIFLNKNKDILIEKLLEKNENGLEIDMEDEMIELNGNAFEDDSDCEVEEPKKKKRKRVEKKLKKKKKHIVKKEVIDFDENNCRTYFEKVDGNMLDYLIKRGKELGLEKVTLSSLRKIKKWSFNKDENTYNKMVVYKQKYGGRLYPEGVSLVYMPREVRNALCRDFCVDIDICNSMPSILNECIKQRNIELKYLNEYCENRDKILEDISETQRWKKSKTKQIILSIFFGMGDDALKHQFMVEELPEFIINLKNDVINARSMLVCGEEFQPFIEKIRKLTPKKKYKSLWAGSFLSYILAYYEWKIVNSIENYFKTNNYKISFLEYDGLKIYADGICNDHLVKCEEYIKKQTGMSIKIAEKEMETNYEIVEEDKGDIFSCPIYSVMKYKFETYNCKIKNPLMYVNWDSRDEMHFKNKSQFGDLYENMTFTYNGKTKSFTKTWFKDPNIKCYEKIDFLPNSDDPTILNLFDGFVVEKLDCDDNADLSLWLSHAKTLVGNNDTYLDWLLDYICHLVCKPEEKPGIALTFKSDEGVGKNMWFENLINNVLGEQYIYVCNDVASIFDRFSVALKNRLMVIVEETDAVHSFKFHEKLKAAITGQYDMYEQKGVQSVKMKSLIRYIFFSNNDVCRKITARNRRDVIFESSSENIGDYEYFSKLSDYLAKPETSRSIYKFLKDRFEKKKITKKMLLLTKPTTEIHKEMAKSTIPKELFFLKDKIDTLKFNSEDENEIIETEERPKKLFSDYVKYMESCRYKHIKSKDKFTKAMSKIFNKRRSNGTIYQITEVDFNNYLKKHNYDLSNID